MLYIWYQELHYSVVFHANIHDIQSNLIISLEYVPPLFIKHSLISHWLAASSKSEVSPIKCPLNLPVHEGNQSKFGK